ncbi:hypothetical protein RSK20926_09192 [Roseobacter sp. SK209-2-6]|uniref:hypothetical protein n=1 Tax=Roseobacter sp. SK209-2-6 TaxID=388739 RepID=UPI0000F3D189|nr:hypothetical protein [Roseobacter sp. SK209-2-6]EBA17134.1 hypothetical protein RSK20926_09192 [Roseobacter sp. SK209-2-6]
MDKKKPPTAQRGIPTRRQRWQVGAIVEIPIGENCWAYGQLGEEYVVAVLDGFFSARPFIEDVTQLPILFKSIVYRDVVSKGYWVRIGRAEPRSDVLQEDYCFKQDQFTGALSLYHSDFSEQGWEKPALLSECLGLECVAVWEAGHVEDRIIATRDGLKCRWVSSLAIDLSRVPAHQNDVH